MSTILFLITLRHPNGETRIVPVEHVAKTYVAIRWGEAGLFDLNLLKNVLTGRRAESQPKGKARWYVKGPNPWVAADIEDVRKQVDVWLGKEDKRKEMEVAIAKHNANMPGANPRIDEEGGPNGRRRHHNEYANVTSYRASVCCDDE